MINFDDDDDDDDDDDENNNDDDELHKLHLTHHSYRLSTCLHLL